MSSIPLDYLFLETDTSEKTIREIYEKAAEQLNLPWGVLKQRIFANFARLNLTTWKTGETEPVDASAIVTEGVEEQNKVSNVGTIGIVPFLVKLG